jgi:hypothetical protein
MKHLNSVAAFQKSARKARGERRGRKLRFSSGCLLGAFVIFISTGAFAQNAMNGWNFKFTNFVIGAFAGPSNSDAQVAAYAQAGFNTIMVGRYMSDQTVYSSPAEVKQEMDLAQKYGLGAFIDGYTENSIAWGGMPFSITNGDQHPISFQEFKWLQADLGTHPALVGYCLRDDVDGTNEEFVNCAPQPDPDLSSIAAYMRTNCPQLFPWVTWCQAFGASGAVLYQMGMPTSSDETYPYGGGSNCPQMTADYVVSYYCQKYFGDSRALQAYGCPYWPLINFGPSDSLLRFPAYAALAYGAKGIWYYTYCNAGAGNNWLQNVGAWTNADDVANNLTELYPVAQAVNNEIASWSPWVMGRTSAGLFGSMPSTQGPFTICTAAVCGYAVPANNGLAAPASYKLVQATPDHVVVGILTKPGALPLAMVVDGLTSTNFGDLTNRSVTVQFAPQVSAIDIIEGGTNSLHTNGNSITLTLYPGGGQLLQLEGSQLDVMTTPSAIYASSPPLTFTLLDYWRMGEKDPGATAGLAAATITDSAGSNNLTDSGQASYSADVATTAQAHVGSTLSVNFSGSGGYATGNLVSTAQDNFGVEAWVKPALVTSDQTIVYNGNTATSGWGLRVNGNNSTYSVLFGGVEFFGSSPAIANVWTHLALVRNNGVATFYVNGIASGTTTNPPNLPGGNFAIGAPPQNPASQPFIGSVDEVRVFTFPAGQFTVSDLLLNESPAFDEVGYWRMGEEDGPQAAVGAAAETTVDSAGSNDLVCFGEPFYSADVSPVAASQTGSEMSLGFSGFGAYAIGALASAAQDNFGLETWVKPTSVTSSQTIVYNGNTSTSGWGLRIDGTDSAYTALFGGVTIFGSSPANPNVWTHLALVRDNGLSTLYVNGTAVAISTAVPNFPAGNFAVATAPESPNTFFAGEVDESRIFNFPPGGFNTNDFLLYQSATPALSGLKLLTNGAFQFGFSSTLSNSWTVVSTTNLLLPFADWTPVGTATNIGSGLFQFTSAPDTNNSERFFGIRSP